MNVCPECKLPLVQPLAWLALEENQWLVCLRCANCRVTYEALLSQEERDRFEEELERGRRALEEGLAQIVRGRMRHRAWEEPA